MTITEFILARVAEDEETAQRELAAQAEWQEQTRGLVGAVVAMPTCMGPERVLAECKAKRTIVERVWSYEFEIDGEWGDSRTIADMQLAGVAPAPLCAMAAIWSDHEDFDPAWQSEKCLVGG